MTTLAKEMKQTAKELNRFLKTGKGSKSAEMPGYKPDDIVEDKATIEIDWDNKLVGVSQQPLDFGATPEKAIETSKAQIIAQIASKYAYDLMQLRPEELAERHLRFLSGL